MSPVAFLPSLLHVRDALITHFFSNMTDISRPRCNDIARNILGATTGVDALTVQGNFSYTVGRIDATARSAGTTVVQFRPACFPLNLRTLSVAKAIHGDIVPDCEHRGLMMARVRLDHRDRRTGELQRLNGVQIYVIQRLPGITYYEARTTQDRLRPQLSLQEYGWQCATIRDLAK
jgi:hypothetical protein